MHLTRWLLVAGVSWVFAASTAQALSFGSPPASVALGSTLNVVVPLRLDPDDQFEPECVNAEVQIGDRRVPAYNLRWAVEPGAAANERLVRVMTLVVVDEPVVVVQVNSGCTARISRRFTAFADPPLTGALGPGAAEASSTPAPTAAMPPRTLQPSPRASMPAASASAAAAAPTARVPKKPRRSTAQSQATPRVAADAARMPPPGARLSLEAPDPAVLQAAVAAAMADHQASAAMNAQSASAAAAAASAAAERVQALEEQVQRLLADGKSQREQLQQLRSRSARGDAASRWLPWVSVALFVSLAAIGWLVLKLRRQQRDAHANWWADAAEVLADARPDPEHVGGNAARSAAVPEAPAKAPAWPPAAPALVDPLVDLGLDTVTADTALGPVTIEPGWSHTSPPPRPVSIEELIDLEQQAEFFVVLGQDDAAIDLLMGHLRDTGGTSPLPYLKLLEIYRRRGDHEAYDRTRERFNQRFNAYAPDWDHDMLHGRTLVDYPQVMMRLQRAWPAPIDAMAELETLMFRKDGGELFELPAYREVLMLYSLARDLMDHAMDPQAARRPDVDVLLPLEPSGFVPLPPGAEVPGIGEATMVLTPDVALDGAAQFHAVDLDLGQSPAPSVPPARGGQRS